MSEYSPAQTEPRVVLIHGFLDDASMWEEVASRLRDTYPTRAIDLPGHGSRAAYAGTLSLETFVAAAVDEIDGEDSPVVLVGQSMGALVAELAAVQRSARVAGLVLVTPVPLAGTRLPEEQAAAFRALGGDAAAQRSGREGLQVSLDEPTLDRIAVSGATLDSRVVSESFDAWNDGDPAGLEPSAYRGPALLIRGEGDPFVNRELFGSVHSRFPSAGTADIARSGHYPHLENPADLGDAILAFARSVAGAEVAR